MRGRRGGIEKPPREYADEGEPGRWLEADLTAAPHAVQVVQELARRLEDAAGGRSARDVARVAGLQHTTVLALLRGDRIPDVATVAKLEEALEVDLWPGRHWD